jgi:hypothetical protein
VNAPVQLSMFGATMPSSSPVGLVVVPPKPCRDCGSDTVIIGSSAGPHHARLNCCGCGCHRGWLSGETFRFISGVIDNFGRPTEPIEIRHNQSAQEHGYPAAAATRGKIMHIDSLYPSRFLRCADLNGRPMRVTIEALKKEDIGGESKVVLSFTNGTKSLILNKTNGRAIAKLHGDETRGWTFSFPRRSISAATSSMRSASAAWQTRARRSSMNRRLPMSRRWTMISATLSPDTDCRR